MCFISGKLKKPSANAIKKGKVPPPTCSTLNHQGHQHDHAHDHEHDESSAEDLTEDEDSDNTYSSSEASKGKFLK